MKLNDSIIYKEFFERNEAAKKIFVKKDNSPWKAGDLFKQKDLEKTLKKDFETWSFWFLFRYSC